jgi:hypothetical protein
MKYQFTDGTPYEGPTIKMPDGRILSGATYMPDSRRVIPMEKEDGGQRSGELHEAQTEEEPVQQSKARGKGRGKRSVVGKKSPKASTSV